MTPRREDEWLHRPDIWAGLALGAFSATKSFSPSLLPRTTSQQAIVSGVAAALGFAVGDTAYWAAARTGSAPGDVAALGGLAVVGLAARRALPPIDGEPVWRSLGRATAQFAAGGGLAAASVVAARGSPRRALATGIGALALGAAATRSVRRGLVAQDGLRDRWDPPPPAPMPALGRSVAVAGVLAAVVNGYRHSGRSLAATVQRRLGAPERVSLWAGELLAAGMWVGTGKLLAGPIVQGFRLYDRVVDPGYDQAPTSAARTAGPGSPLGFARTGREGRRFVTDAPSPEEIEAVTGRPAVADPIRVYVGHDQARTIEERVELAMAELRRTGAFDRRLLVVGCPAGNGVVNTLPLEVLDHVLAGDTAAVAVQYARLPSVLTLHRVGRGGRSHRLLLEAIRDELASRPPEGRPRVVVYGESLGAWAGQNAFLHEGVDGFDAVGVDRALWVGTPYYSGWRRELLGEALPGRPPTDGELRVAEVTGPGELDRLLAEGRRLRAVLLSHTNDPVRYISLGLLVQEPSWLQGDRPPRVPREMTYEPVVTAVHVIVDTLNATHPTPGVFRATGHDYRANLPDVTLAAYGVARPDPATWERLLAHLQLREAERAAKFHLPRPPRPDEGGGSGAPTPARAGRARRRLRRRRREPAGRAALS
ncbi:MAG: alpha/beta hydrolase [Acidimicrobiales bacterium]|nr:alpha/beta hydrolase [Acidimicrobiales bacterium]